MTDRTWQEAVDPALTARLWRRGERPGLIRHDLAVTILTRHRGMVAGLPLADMLLRRENISNDPGVALDAPLPVVSASPAPATVAPPASAGAPGAWAPARRGPADGAPAAAGPAASSPAAGPPPRHVTAVRPQPSAADVVVQRMPAAAAPPLAPPRDAPPLDGPPHALPPADAFQDVPRIRAVPGLPETASVPGQPPPADDGAGGASLAALPVVVAAPIADQRPVTASRPLVVVTYAEQPAGAGGPLRAETGDHGRASDRGAALVVVREQPRRASGPEPGLAADRRRAPLPLAGIPVTGDPARPPHPAPAPQRAASPPRPAASSQGHAAQQRNEPVRSQAGPDAGRIAETVRRRFLRELSIEAERRGAGWES